MSNETSNVSFLKTNQTFEAEAMVIGSILQDADLLATCVLDVSDFQNPKNQIIFTALRQMEDEQEPIELPSLVMALEDSLDTIGFDYLVDAMDAVITTGNFNFYVDKVRESSKSREAKRLALEFAEDNLTIDELLHQLTALELGKQVGESQTMKEIMTDMFRDLSTEKDLITGIRSGFSELDYMLDGFKGGELIVVGARPAMGKTAFVLNLGKNISMNSIGVSLFNYEMGTLQVGRRLFASIANIKTKNLSNGSRMSPEHWETFAAHAGSAADMPINIHKATGMTTRMIRQAIIQDRKRFERDYGTKEHIVMIDYLQLIASTNPTDNQNQRVSEISRDLKVMAQQLNVTIILLSQLSRGVEQRQDKRPMMSDLRDSGAVEQDADVVMMLYRDEYYNPESIDRDTVEVIVTKQREGATGTVKLLFQKEFGKMLSHAEPEYV